MLFQVLNWTFLCMKFFNCCTMSSFLELWKHGMTQYIYHVEAFGKVSITLNPRWLIEKEKQLIMFLLPPLEDSRKRGDIVFIFPFMILILCSSEHCSKCPVIQPNLSKTLIAPRRYIRLGRHLEMIVRSVSWHVYVYVANCNVIRRIWKSRKQSGILKDIISISTGGLTLEKSKFTTNDCRK